MALSGGIVLEETVDLSSDITDEWRCQTEIRRFVCGILTVEVMSSWIRCNYYDWEVGGKRLHIFVPLQNCNGRERRRKSRTVRQCTCNATLRRVRESLLPWKRNNNTYLSVGVCACACARVCGRGCMGTDGCLRVCSLTNLACNAQPYCHLRPLWLHRIFRHYVINGTIFGKTLPNIKRVLWFSL
jgi:hypothetical protein